LLKYPTRSMFKEESSKETTKLTSTLPGDLHLDRDF
jgi:hypothetical protein